MYSKIILYYYSNMSAICKMRTTLVKPHFSLKQKQEAKNVVDFILDELKQLDIR